MKSKRKKGLFAQVYTLTAIAIVVAGIIVFETQFLITRNNSADERKAEAAETIGEAVWTMEQYPALDWLLSYWKAHAGEMEIEYDEWLHKGTRTQEKCSLLAQRHPGFLLRYATQEEIEALPSRDQKLYAEIVYSWVIDSFDAVKKSFGCDFLFCVQTDTDEGEDPYGTLFYLLSAADQDSERGTEYEQVYTLGVEVSVDDESTKEIMREAVAKGCDPDTPMVKRVATERLNEAGRYIDNYALLEPAGDHAVLVGATFYLGDIMSEIRTWSLWSSLIAMGYLLLLVTFIMRHIVLYMLKPLKKVLEIIRSYTASKDSSTVERNMAQVLSGRRAVAVRRNEIGQLAEDFVDLTKEIDVYTAQIEKAAAEKKRMEYELDIAANIQAQMLPDPQPHFPEHPEFTLSASMSPAREVGGDFYDYFFVDDDHLAMVIADVSDKGIPAALFMARAKALFRSRLQTGEEPAGVLYYVNNQLAEENEAGYFVTVWMAVIDLRTGMGVVSNAGHENPAMYRKGGLYELVSYRHSLVVGMMEDYSYEQHTVQLNPGDRLFVYTDGVPEAANTDDEQFGTDRMLEALNRDPDAEPAALLQNVTAAIREFVGEAPQFDDTTMMCLHYSGVEEAKEAAEPGQAE